MAAQIEYVIGMLDSLQDLLVITMESLEYANRYGSRGATGNSQRTKSRTPRQLGVIPDFEVHADLYRSKKINLQVSQVNIVTNK